MTNDILAKEAARLRKGQWLYLLSILMTVNAAIAWFIWGRVFLEPAIGQVSPQLRANVEAVEPATAQEQKLKAHLLSSLNFGEDLSRLLTRVLTRGIGAAIAFLAILPATTWLGRRALLRTLERIARERAAPPPLLGP